MKITIAIGLVLAAIRVWIGVAITPEHLSGQALAVNCYKDVAHIFVGSLIPSAWKSNGWQRWLFWGLCALEVAVAVISRIH